MPRDARHRPWSLNRTRAQWQQRARSTNHRAERPGCPPALLGVSAHPCSQGPPWTSGEGGTGGGSRGGRRGVLLLERMVRGYGFLGQTDPQHSPDASARSLCAQRGAFVVAEPLLLFSPPQGKTKRGRIQSWGAAAARSKCLVNVTRQDNHIQGSEKSCGKAPARPGCRRSHRGAREGPRSREFQRTVCPPRLKALPGGGAEAQAPQAQIRGLRAAASSLPQVRSPRQTLRGVRRPRAGSGMTNFTSSPWR